MASPPPAHRSKPYPESQTASLRLRRTPQAARPRTYHPPDRAPSRQAYEAETGDTAAADIKPLDTFYPAETYHQDYAKKNPNDR